MVSSRALRGCVDGECEVHVPGLLAHSSTWISANFPSFVNYMIDLKPFWVKEEDGDEEGAKTSSSKNSDESKKDK
jgi:hypothetical protein